MDFTEHTAVALAKIQAASAAPVNPRFCCWAHNDEDCARIAAAPRDRHTRVLAYELAKLDADWQRDR